MPLRLIGMIIVLVIVTFFAGFNLDNKCNVNLIFKNFQNVPVFFSIMLAFLAGIIVTLPFTFGKSHKNKKEDDAKKLEKLKAKEEAAAKKLAEKAKKEAESKAKSAEKEAKETEEPESSENSNTSETSENN